MPIKLPKGFARRKSSANALEEVPNPPQPSFRVFERPLGAGKSFDGTTTLRKRMIDRSDDTRPMSEGRFGESGGVIDLNHRSGGTGHSSSSGGVYDASSLARYSSTSTLPSSSSIDRKSDDASHTHPKTTHNVPMPPVPHAPSGFSLRAAGRTFSFGRKAAQAAHSAAQAAHAAEVAQDARPSAPPLPFSPTESPYGGIPDVGLGTRSRGTTETSHASGSTARAPQILDTSLDFGGSDDLDGFGSMFDGVGKDKVQSIQARQQPRDGYLANRSPYALPPLIVDRSKNVTPAPHSNSTVDSHDGLMASPEDEQAAFHYDAPGQTNGHGYSTPATAKPQEDEIRARRSRPQEPGNALRRSSAYGGRRKSSMAADVDAMLVRESVQASRQMDRKSFGTTDKPRLASDRGGGGSAVHRKALPQTDPNRSTAARTAALLFDDDSRTEASPRGAGSKVAGPEEALLDDLSFREIARSADRYQQGTAPGQQQAGPSKVMTPVQFEMYRKQQELQRTGSNATKSEASDDDDAGEQFDEDDEAERGREVAKQRQKQEAHLSVYRQQMMKVTGEQSAGLGPMRSAMSRMGQNSSNLGSRLSTVHLSKTSDDEDEDIPLGILAAHGFPSKERPPQHLSRMGSAPNIRYASETYPPPPPVPSGSAAGGGLRAPLPPFARNLPKDPYYGSSIVNPSNRESMGLGGSGASAYGGSQSGLPPGGLVGVIAQEERARAMRRGSPNTGSSMPNTPGPSMPGMPPSPMVDQQAQMAQMAQMMQMQMQWMQQMMSAQGMHAGQMTPGMQMPPGMQLPPGMQMPFSPPSTYGFLSPSGSGMGSPGQRPMSASPGTTNNHGRAMSMLSPGSRVSMVPSLHQRSSTANILGPGPGYTPSIAPSERSNVGMPSRYRPVSIAPTDEPTGGVGQRASTFTASTSVGSWAKLESAPQPRRATEQGSGAKGQKQTAKKGSEDEDEEEGWEEMRRKKEKKRAFWRGRKGDGGSGPSEAKGLEGVFYPEEGY